MDGGNLGANIGTPTTITTSGDISLNADFQFASNTTITLTGNSLIIPAVTRTIDLLGTLALTNNLSGGATIVTAGSGTLSVSGTNTGVNFQVSNSSTLAITNPASLASASIINISNGATLYLNTAAGSTVSNLAAVTGSGTLKIKVNGTGSSTTTVAPLLGSFTGNIVVGDGSVNGNAKLSLATTPIPNITIDVTANSTLFLPTNATSSGTIILRGGDTGESIGQLRIDGATGFGGNIILAGDTLTSDATIGCNSGTLVLTSTITESGGARNFTKGGAGTLVRSTPLGVTGTIRVIGGTLQFNIGTTAGTSTFFGSCPLSIGGATLEILSSATSNSITIPNNITVTSAGTLKSTEGIKTYSGTITLNAGLTINQTVASKYVILSGNISGTGRITKQNASGSDGLVLSGTNSSWSGGLTMSTAGDTVYINSATALGTGQLISSNGTWLANSSGGAITCNVTGGVSMGTYMTFVGPNDLTIGGGNWVMGAARSIYVKDGCNATINAPITGAFALTRANAAGYGGNLYLGGNSTFTGIFTVAQGTVYGNYGVAFNGGIATCFGTNTSLVVNAGCTIVSNTSQSVSGGQTTTRVITLGGIGATWRLLNGQEYFYSVNMTGATISDSTSARYLRCATNGGIVTTNSSTTSSTISGALDMTMNGLSLTVADNATQEKDLIISANITENTGAGSGARSITKAGAGAVFIQSTTNLYTGTTTVSAGTLAGIGKTGTGLTQINSGATIQGGDGAGNAGTLTTGGALTLDLGALVRVTHTVSAVARVAVTGNITLNSNAVTFEATALNAGTYTLFTYTGTLSGTLATPTLTGTGRTFGSYSYTGGSVTVTLT